MPDPDVHTEHDPREPVVGHARVDDDAVADPDAEPVAGDAPADGSATTYESAAHNGHDGPDDSYVTDAPFGGNTAFGTGNEPTVEDADGYAADGDRSAFDQHSPDEHVADEHAADEDPADGEPLDEAPAGEPVDETHGDVADLAGHSDDDHAEVGDGTAEVVDDTGVVAIETAALPVHPETETPGDQALKPGAAETTPLGKLWADADVVGMRARWRELQLKFIDDPQAVAGEAESLVTEAVDALTAALNARKDALSDWRGAEDTERLRAAVRRYRDLFDQLLAL